MRVHNNLGLVAFWACKLHAYSNYLAQSCIHTEECPLRECYRGNVRGMLGVKMPGQCPGEIVGFL